MKRSIIIQDEKKTLERVLSNRSNKKPLELLMNRTGSFHQINQIKDKIELQKPFEERFRKHGWIMGLRRCKDSKAPRYGFVEIKGQTHPIWSTIIDRSKEREKIIQNNCFNLFNLAHCTVYCRNNIDTFKLLILETNLNIMVDIQYDTYYPAIIVDI